ncbi:hypothetical protein [Streptomyces sp. SD31]|uniref:hypothetical protein n=1 Tax=Streptomyces sp. SD31 TaxID=3452208 RepID=UPI003F8A2C10
MPPLTLTPALTITLVQALDLALVLPLLPLPLAQTIPESEQTASWPEPIAPEPDQTVPDPTTPFSRHARSRSRPGRAVCPA